MKLRRGLDGEALVGKKLEELSDEYFVIHDMDTGYGNIDHVVVGPTGVYLLDAKAWRGTITADGKGELLRDGKAATTAHVSRFVRRVMDVRARVQALAPDTSPYCKGVFVFTAARVDARFGETGPVDCIQDDRLIDYVAGEKRPKRIRPDDAELLAKAFAALARMEDGFDS